MSMKTLLVGLGGTGCEIVARVKRRSNPDNPDVQYIGFDTDGSWDGVDGLSVIYTSREMTVREYLKDFDNWQEWFPDSAMLMPRKMVKGAGQIRTLSRLAFAETVSSGRIGKLDDAIRKLHLARGEVTPQNFRVMVVSSFAGGTGSGMFIQTALFLRDYIRRNYGGEVIMRGLFALPDLFMSGNPSPVQRESMYANAYAALKELNAINRVCLSTDPTADEIDIKIDDLFDSKRDRRKAEKAPFNFIFFVDNINERGQVLGSVEEYKELMATVTYMQVNSPMTDQGDSREDNAIGSLILSDGENIYCGAGAARLVYPYEDLLKYCGTRATVESISEVWTVIDAEYRKADAENKKLRLIDPTVKELDRSEHFIATLGSLLEQNTASLGFVNAAVTDYSEDGKKVDRAGAFYDNVYAFVCDKIKKDELVRSKADNAGVNQRQLKGNLATVVDGNESALKDYLDAVTDRISLLRTSAVQSIVPFDLTTSLETDRDWNITKLIMSNNNVVHPLAVRMLLYKFRKSVADAHGSASADADSKYKQINRYFKEAYDIKGTEVVESAVDRANEKGMFKKGAFIADYLAKSTAQKSRIDGYAVNKFVAEVFGELLGVIDSLIEQYERLFDSLEEIKKTLNKRVDVLENKMHQSTSDSSTYLCASPEAKRELYESINFRCSDSNDNGVYNSIFYSLYDAAKEARDAKQRKKATKLSERKAEEIRNATMSKIFDDSVVSRNIEDVGTDCRDQIDINVYEALSKHCDGEMSEVLGMFGSTYDKSLPYLKHTSDKKIHSLDGNGAESGCAYKLTFWGVNPEVAAQIIGENDLADIRSFFSVTPEGGVPDVVSSEEYSRYEISCYEALYCIALKDVPKFLESGDSFGVFYENYATRVTRMAKDSNKTAVTPHLDIRWHRRCHVPMIGDDKNREDDKRVARAIWLALIYGGLPEATVQGRKAVYAVFNATADKKAVPEQKYPSREILLKGKHIRVTDAYELYKALQVDEITTLRFIEVYEKSLANDMETGLENKDFVGPRARRFAKKLISADEPDRNALNILARFVAHAKATDEERAIFTEALLELIDEFCSDLTEERQIELRKHILKASRFAIKTSKAKKTDSDKKDDGGKKTTAVSKATNNRARVERHINFDYWEGK